MRLAAGITLLLIVPLGLGFYLLSRFHLEQTIEALAKAVDARDPYTRNHSSRVSHIAEAMCRVMRLPEHDIERIKWAGLLHDLDWEQYPEEHPVRAVNELRGLGYPESVLHAILAHRADYTHTEAETDLDKHLLACDEITGLVTAVALVRPSRSLLDLEVKSVKKKWKDKAFAAGTSRTEMEHAAQEFGMELWEHVGNVIQAMSRIAPELGLVGTISR